MLQAVPLRPRGEHGKEKAIQYPHPVKGDVQKIRDQRRYAWVLPRDRDQDIGNKHRYPPHDVNDTKSDNARAQAQGFGGFGAGDRHVTLIVDVDGHVER